jgi:hypothetical protein
MNDRSEDVETAATCAHSHKPAWWTDSLETSWGKAKMEATQDWGQIVEGEKRIAHRVDVEAIAFGYGAHHAYHDFQVWGDKLEAVLRADWKETGHDAECAWARVSAAVRHGWERAMNAQRPAAGPAGSDAQTSTQRPHAVP